ncbi:MAG: ParB/RepB/Spo0J family partition protein [Elusimicrobiota bacterium]
MHKALGKGLEALIPVLTQIKEGDEASAKKVSSLQIHGIRPNRYQARMIFDPEKLQELSDSIKNSGVIQPILVRPTAISGEYELIAGERRLRAAKLAGLREIPAIIQPLNDEQLCAVSLIENLQRENLNPVEEAEAYQRLIEKFELTQEILAKQLGKTRSSIANTLRLIHLPEEVKENIILGKISAGHARSLASIEDKAKLKELATRIVNQKLTVREVEEWVKKWKIGKSPHKAKPTQKKGLEIVELEEDLQRVLGTKVRVQYRAQKGKIEVFFFSLEEMERIVKILKRK